MDQQACSFTFNDFFQTIARSFSRVRNDEEFCDVTLVSDDLIPVSAHKLVLSSTSEYFRTVLKQSKQAQPMVCLEGISSKELIQVLDYVYDGEVRLEQSNLQRFLELAQRFKLEGIEEQKPPPVQNWFQSLETKSEYPDPQIDLEEKIDFDENDDDDVDIDDEVEIDEFELEESFSNGTQKRENKEYRYIKRENMSIKFDNEVITNVDDLKKKVNQQVIKKMNGTFACKICGKICTKMSNMKEHIETHFEGIMFACSNCGREFTSRSTLRSHNIRAHKRSES